VEKGKCIFTCRKELVVLELSDAPPYQDKSYNFLQLKLGTSGVWCRAVWWIDMNISGESAISYFRVKEFQLSLTLFI
jgi:hypothetical protein